jgi:hypothetical protein
VAVPWAFVDKWGYTAPQAGEFIKAGVDLTALYGATVPTFVSYLSETRSSASEEATLSDFALGSVRTIGKNYAVVAGQYTNVATVAGVGATTNLSATGADAANIFGTTGFRAESAAASPAIDVKTAVLAADPLAPTAVEDADAAPGPAFPTGTPVTRTYLVRNPGDVPVAIDDLTDDAGTPSSPADDFRPRYLGGDANADGLLDPGETWLYTSAGIWAYNVAAGQAVGRATVTGRGAPTGTAVTATDAAFHYGQARAEGRVPGFWRTAAAKGAAAWPRDGAGRLVFPTTTTLESVFDVPDGLKRDTTTLVQALGLTATTGPGALLRSAAAALLNAAHPRVAYPLTAGQVIAQVNGALGGGPAAATALRTTLDRYNALGSDLTVRGTTNGVIRAASRPVGNETTATLTAGRLAPFVAEAVARWQAAGAVISGTDFRLTIGKLTNGGLARTVDNVITIDPRAGGFGWYLDPTPGDDVEFAGATAPGGMDLLTVLVHELGHVLGLEDLMGETLAPGVRRGPADAG